MTRFVATVRKELLLLMKDPGGLVMLFILPAVFIVVLSTALQGAFSGPDTDETIDVLVVDNDEGGFGKTLLDLLEKSPHFNPIQKGDAAEGRADVAAGIHPLLIEVPKGAGEAAKMNGEAEIRIYQDPAFSKEVTLALEGTVKELVHLTLLKNALAKGPPPIPPTRDGENTAPVKEERSPQAVSIGLTVKKQIAKREGAEEVNPNAVQQNVPGWTIYALFWIAQVLAINIIGERESGAFKRVMASPTGFRRYMLSKSAPYLIINLLQAIFLFLVGIHFLPVVGCPELVVTNIPALAVLTIAVSITAIAFGLLMAALSRTTFVASSVSATVLIVMTAVGGIMVPKFIMPAAMQKAAMAVPQGWALEGYLDILVRGKGLGDITGVLCALLGFAAVFTIVGLYRMSRMVRV